MNWRCAHCVNRLLESVSFELQTGGVGVESCNYGAQAFVKARRLPECHRRARRATCTSTGADVWIENRHQV